MDAGIVVAALRDRRAARRSGARGHVTWSRVREVVVATSYGLVGWAVSGAAMSVALWLASRATAALAAHALVVPVAFAFVSLVYFRRAEPVRPLVAAVLFGGIVFAMDAVTAAVFPRAADARTVVLGTCLPAYAAVAATWLTGIASEATRPRAAA